MTRGLLMGAVAYDPKVVQIWDGFRRWLRDNGLAFDYLLYSNYERQVEDLIAGHLHVAWNSPLAWIRAVRLGASTGRTVHSVVMRDTDQDLTSVIVARAGSSIHSIADLRGKVVGLGAVDSPQATLIPLAHLRAAGLDPGVDFTIRRFDVGVGLHGDHIGGERAAAQAMVAGDVDAVAMIDSNHLLFGQEGVLPAGGTRVLARTDLFDHCNMTVAGHPSAAVERFVELLLGMSYADPVVRPLLDLEGLKAWVPGRDTGYRLLTDAVEELGFYDAKGAVTASGYAP